MYFNVPYFIARRYLFSKKSHNIINIISWISVAGVSVGAMALVVVLSVFNGFDSLIQSLMHSFDPDIKIVLKEGKTFHIDTPEFEKALQIDGIQAYSSVLEEKAIFKNGARQHIATLKGVEKSFESMTGIDTMMIDGEFKLSEDRYNFAIFGFAIARMLSVSLPPFQPVAVYVPKRDAKISVNPASAINKSYIMPSGIFSIQSEFDTKYVIVPIDFVREILDFTNEVTALEIKVEPQLSTSEREDLNNTIGSIIGPEYKVLNRYQQHEMLYKIMESEKWAIFLILTFILIIASFNIVGSITMLIVDKKNDIATLESLGAARKFVRNIFFNQGLLISLGGAFIGLLLGIAICLIQIHFNIISFPHSSVISSYPVEIRPTDLLVVFFAVIVIGVFAAWYPVRYVTKKFTGIE